MRITRSMVLLILGLASLSSSAKTLLIKGIIHTAAGETFDPGMMVIRDGIILSVSTHDETVFQRYDTSSAEITFKDYGTGHIYPGLIALNTTLGITEIDQVRATHDYDEVGQNNANVRSIIAYNTDSKVVPTVKSNGILFAEVAPQGGLISGQSSLVNTEGWNWEDAAVRMDVGIHLHWPSKIKHRGWWAEPESPVKSVNAEELKKLQNIFDKAANYHEHQLKDPDAKTAALLDLFSGKKKLFVHADAASDMVDAILFFKAYHITPVIVGAKEAAKILSFLKAEDVALVLVRTHDLPSYGHSDVQEIYRTPAILADSGIRFAITDQSHWQQRNLPFQAGTAIAYGLDTEKALQSITLHPASLMGVSDRLGSLEKGKEASFIVSSGDLFDMRSSIVIAAYIKGEATPLSNKQKELYEKYRSKYGID